MENLPEDAEVIVDGAAVTLTTRNGETAEISVAPGKKCQLKVKKAGFQVFAKELEIDAGERQPIKVNLEPLPEEPIVQQDSAPPANVPTPDGEAVLTQILRDNTWFYHDDLYPPGENFQFNADGTFHSWRWNYWVVGPREIRIHYDRNNHDKDSGIPFTFNEELTEFAGEFTDQRGRVHKVTGTRQ
ncbi:MAG: hypothetical protein ACJ8FY_23990 [Gemmataceae bacterium]